MDTDTLIWVIVAVVVVLAILAAVAMGMSSKNKRREEQRRAEADQLRHEAAATTPSLSEAQLRAQEAEAQAELARTQAERADQQATAERQRLAAEEAQREDLVREADRLDPDVDHRADGYAPDVHGTPAAAQDGTGTPDAPGASGPTGTGGAHRS